MRTQGLPVEENEKKIYIYFFLNQKISFAYHVHLHHWDLLRILCCSILVLISTKNIH